MQSSFDVIQVMNGGWDERILVFQYQQIVTSFAVICERYVILLDTLVNPQSARALLGAVHESLNGGRQLLVVNTHADWDHCWGNAVFAGPDAIQQVPIIAHRRCRERLFAPEAATTLTEKQQHEPELYKDVKIVPPTVTFEGTLTIDGGDLQLELIPTPGHTSDHLSVYIPQIATLLPGDAAEQPLPFVDTPATLPQLRASLGHLKALNAETALYCHAIGERSPSIIDANIAYFDTLEQRCRHALTAKIVPRDLEEIADIEELLDYQLADIPGAGALDVEATTFYREAHHQAALAMLSYLRATT